jgi:endonuclease YncB( thermonuclease family)
VAVVRGLLLALLPLLLALPASAAPGGLPATVVRIVDGDTIQVRIADRLEKVRYIGMNTPEIHHPRKGEEPWGREASEVNRELVAGKQVRLELDVQERDRYGRLLAYVWVGDAGRERVPSTPAARTRRRGAAARAAGPRGTRPAAPGRRARYVSRSTRPATARTWRGAASQMAIAESAQQPIAIQKASA